MSVLECVCERVYMCMFMHALIFLGVCECALVFECLCVSVCVFVVYVS